MKAKVEFILFILLVSLPVSGMAQWSRMNYRDRLGDSVVLVNTAQKPPRVKRPPMYKRSFSGGVRLQSNGWGIFADKGFLYGNEVFGSINRNKYFQVKVLELSLSEIKHAKEIKANSVLPGMAFQPGGYILGKINNFYQANLGFGYRRLIAGKPDPGTVSIHWTYIGGFSAGLLKPYYLDLYQYGSVKYSEDIQNEFISPGMIIGKSGFSKGLNEIKVIPGLFLRTGLNFDFAPGKKGIAAIEAGVQGAYYFQEIAQMVGQDPKKAFFSFFASLQFGGKR